MKEIVEILTKKHKTIATMESCTGGGVANAITNIEGASEILKFSAVTYSNEYKIKMGVDPQIIADYSVYSMNTAIEMSSKIASFANANYGVGITGKLNRLDKFNPIGANNQIFVSIYDKDADKYYNFDLLANKTTRSENKEMIIQAIEQKLLEIM